MKLEEQLLAYGAYHQNSKNRLTHFFGIPLVLLSLFLLLHSIQFPIGERTLSLAWVALLALSVYYMILHFGLGLLLTVYSLLCVVGAQWLWINHPSSFWWVAGITMALGWAFQFLGHFFEGKRPAFFKNILHLLNGPLFIAHEVWVLLKRFAK